jgi:hypothetical protein
MADSLSNISITTETINDVLVSIGGINRTNGISPIGLIGRNNKREPAGFTPNVLFAPSEIVDNNDSWYGALLETHPDYSNESSRYLYDTKNIEKNDLSTSDRFDQSKSYPNFKDNIPDPSQYFSTRDYYLLFNDTSTDYFRHGLHIIDNKTPLRSDKNSRETWDGSEEGEPLRLSIFNNTPYENNDPVIFGFELIIDSVSSPLLNGAVEDFIGQFSNISEVAVRKYVLSDFKEQFSKLFKTTGAIFRDPTANTQPKASIINNGYPNSQSNTNIFEGGKKAYMSYYLKKVGGLELLIESNTGTKRKYFADYRNDIIKLVFTEDVSLTIGTLAHLYKLLYWSKTNGKNIIPENLLRFNCDIIISEVRNLNRVRKAINTGNLEVIKENVSRHIYSLKECQFWFDQPTHDNEIDLSSLSNSGFDSYTVNMDYKFSTHKFERWAPDKQGFGQYVGYNNGALWKVGNQGSRTQQTPQDNSVPKFYTVGENYLKQNGVITPVIFNSYSRNGVKNKQATSDDGYGITENTNIENLENTQTSSLDNFKKESKNKSNIITNNAYKIESKVSKIKNDTRAKLLSDTIDKIKVDIYKSRFGEAIFQKFKINTINPILNKLKFTMPSGAPFKIPNPFNISDSITDFTGNSIGSILGNSNIFGGGS